MKKFFLFSFLLIGTAALAQIKTPAPSPLGKLIQTVGLTDVTVEYSRPSAKGRTIFGDLVPFGTMWRTGANASTKVTFSEDVVVEGVAVKAGTYALFTTPGQTEWDVILYKNSKVNGVPSPWDPAEEAARFKVKSQTLPIDVETLMFNIGMITNDGAQLQLVWQKTLVPINFTVPTEAAVMKNIDKVMAGPAAGDYFAAGRYMFEANKDKKKALEYIQKANSLDPKFWTLRTESLVLADLGRKSDAIATAKRSLELAKTAENDDYIRMNEKSIAEWSKK
ncbi:MAG: DUF2911 domain-containing protein [Saprospiraceae bacterium]|nr:DUF2911 domain-containing protein [Saprospiraceae bacterium]